jgi:molecular chaperone HtpG
MTNTANSTNTTPQTHVFQAEVKQLLNLMIHSLYSNKEIFLRELISNASDALDKRRFLALSDAALGGDEARVRISFDKAANTLTIADTGVGMDADDAQAHLGTIAKSGTKEFFGKLSGDQQKDAALIGQFGVGFYSAFIVAKNVVVRSRKAGKASVDAIEWSSAGEGEYTLNTITKEEVGTQVTLHLRSAGDAGSDADLDSSEFADRWKISELVKKYSNHVSFPIQMVKEDWDEKENKFVSTGEWETVNEASSLWTRSKNELSKADYDGFYASLSYDREPPLAYTHNRVEGRSEYTQLLYLPATAPFDLYERDRVAGVKLYVKRVFIMDDAKALMPSYLRFIKGVIDSNDLPLNVSRELLQESRDVKAIREGSTKRVLSMIEDLAANDPDAFTKFYATFGAVLKEGTGEDFANKDRIAKILRFASTTQAVPTSFADYLTRMKPEQTQIYVLTADTLAAAKASPQLEGFKKKGVEVLLLTDRVDEWMLSHLRDFDGKPITNVTKGAAGLESLQDEAEKAEAAKIAQDMKPLVEAIKAALGEKVKEVRTTSRLTDSAACLVVADGEMSGHLARMLKQAGQEAPEVKPILEINPTHALVARMQAKAEQVPALSQLLLDHATLAEGGVLEDPAGYVQRVNALLLG